MGRTRVVACAFIAAACALPAAAQGAPPVPQPYGKNDAGGFRDVLPPGANGRDNWLQLAQFFSTGKRPPHMMRGVGRI